MHASLPSRLACLCPSPLSLARAHTHMRSGAQQHARALVMRSRACPLARTQTNTRRGSGRTRGKRSTGQPWESATAAALSTPSTDHPPDLAFYRLLLPPVLHLAQVLPLQSACVVGCVADVSGCVCTGVQACTRERAPRGYACHEHRTLCVQCILCVCTVPCLCAMLAVCATEPCLVLCTPSSSI